MGASLLRELDRALRRSLIVLRSEVLLETRLDFGLGHGFRSLEVAPRSCFQFLPRLEVHELAFGLDRFLSEAARDALQVFEGVDR